MVPLSLRERAGAAAAPLAGVLDAKLLSACIHCGLCTSSCPTYAEVGDENDGPRGRIQLMRLVSEDGLPLSDRIAPPLGTLPRLPRAKRPARPVSAMAN